MSKADRRGMIEDIVRAAPSRLGLAEAARRNAEALGDEELSELHGKLVAVRAHSAKVRTGTTGGGGDAEAAIVAKRRALYAKLRSLGSESTPEDVAQDDMPWPSPIDLEGVAERHEAFVGSMRFWNQIEARPKDQLTDRLLKVVSAWMLQFEQMAFKHVFPRAIATPLLRHEALQGELQAYYELALDKLGRDTLRIIRNHVAHQGSPSLDEDIDHRMLTWLLTDRALSNPSLDFAFFNATRGTLPHVRAMEGLAKVRFLAHDYGADTIISMSGGGEMVGDFLAGQRRSAPHRVVMRRHGSGFHFAGDGRQLVVEAKRILLVDDVLNRGGVLTAAHTQIASLARSASIQIVALVGTAEARSSLMDQHRSAFVPNVTVDEETDVPWTRDGTYVYASGKHTFGAGGARPWTVASRELKQIGEDLAAGA